MEKKKIIVIGNGWAGTSFIKNIDSSKYDIEIISSTDEFVYSPYLIKSFFEDTKTCFGIHSFNTLKHIKSNIENINFKDNKITINDIDVYEYDYLVFAHGCDINDFNIDGVQKYCLIVKDASNVQHIKQVLTGLKDNSNVAIIGCGLSGSELIGHLIDLNKYNIYAIDALDKPVSMFSKKIKDYTFDLWKENKVNMYFDSYVSKIDRDRIHFKNRDSIDYHVAFWCGGFKISKLSKLINDRLKLDNRFGIPVDNNLCVQNNIFAIGDCAYNKKFTELSAQCASRQGEYLANRFNNFFKDDTVFTYKSNGKTAYIGKQNAIFENRYVSGGGKLVGYVNTFIHMYELFRIK